MTDLDQEHRKRLIERYVAGEATEKELQAFFGLLSKTELDELIETHMDHEILAMRQVKQPKHRWKITAAAASILIILSFGAYFFIHQQSPKPIAQVRDIAPGGNKAVLTLANGQKISLTDAKNGTLTQQGATLVSKTGNGQLVYENSSKASAVIYNTLSTPKGGQYHLVLADGTNVWLNAASSIKYPVAFTGNDRRVEIAGEAYFEVAHDKKRPFTVSSNGQAVEVLGTHFDINAYRDEPEMKTTLLEGSVKITENGEIALLKPGQQAVIKYAQPHIMVDNVDTEEATAWKNGYFLFDNESLQSVMRKVSRWYNVDVEYPPGQQVNETYGGSITRYGNVSKLLKMLELTGDVRFKIDGNKIVVLKK